MPAPHTTAMPRGSSRPARRSGEGVVEDLARPAPAWARDRRPRAPPARPGGRRWRGRPPRAGTTGAARRDDAGVRARAFSTMGASPATAASAPTPVGRNGPPRAVPTSRPSVAIERDVGLAVAGVDREDRRAASIGSPISGPREVVAVVVDQPVGRDRARVDLADERVRQQGLEDPVVAAVERGVQRQVLVRRDRARPARRTAEPAGRPAAGVRRSGRPWRAPRSPRRRAGTAGCRRCAG